MVNVLHLLLLMVWLCGLLLLTGMGGTLCFGAWLKIMM